MNDTFNHGANVGKEEDIDFPVNEWKNEHENNVLEKGRYEFEVIDAYPRTSNAGNELCVVKLKIGEKRITDWLIRCDSQGLKHSMTFKFHNFLFALGIRNSNTRFNVSKSQLVGKKGLCDISIKKDNEAENNIDGYSPIEEATAPIKGVPSETEAPKKEEEKVVDAEVVNDGVDDL